MSNGSTGNGCKAGSATPQTHPGLRTVTVVEARRLVQALDKLASSTEKNRRWRRTATIRRCATCTAHSTSALSRDLYDRAGTIPKPYHFHKSWMRELAHGPNLRRSTSTFKYEVPYSVRWDYTCCAGRFPFRSWPALGQQSVSDTRQS